MTLLNLLFLNLGGGEIFVIMVVILLFFGSKRIPDLAKGLGKGMREFKDAMSGIENEVRNAANETSKPATPAQPVIPATPDAATPTTPTTPPTAEKIAEETKGNETAG